MRRVALFTLLVLCGLHLRAAAADNWLQFRGADGQGHATSTDCPLHFSMDQAVVWKTPIPGKGWSTPAVADGRIWLTTALPQAASADEFERRLGDDPQKGMKELATSIDLRAMCIDFQTGQVLHDIPLSKVDNPDPINPLNSFASPSPVIDGDNVYCHFGSYGTWCLDHLTGEMKWTRKLVVNHSVGPGSSPYIANDLLVLVCDGTDKQFVAALNKLTGEDVWQTSRPEMRAENGEQRKAYSTPITIEVEGKPQLVIPGAQWICGYELETGKEIWRIDHGRGFSTSPMPVRTDDGLIVFSTGFMKPEMVAVDPNGIGDVTETNIAWRSSKGAPAKPSPIVAGGGIYIVSDLGVLTKLRADDGSVLWQQRLGGNFSASPVQVGDKLIFCSHEGVVTIVQVGDTYQEIAQNQLEARLMASPIVVDNQLIMRTEFHLLRIGS